MVEVRPLARDAYKYSNRIRVRIEHGWATIVDPSLMTSMRKMIDMPDTCKQAPTPSVKRQADESETCRAGLSNTDYRSVVGKFIHLCVDTGMMAFAVKELSRSLSAPECLVCSF